jgi:hypothetical protein
LVCIEGKDGVGSCLPSCVLYGTIRRTGPFRPAVLYRGTTVMVRLRWNVVPPWDKVRVGVRGSESPARQVSNEAWSCLCSFSVLSSLMPLRPLQLRREGREDRSAGARKTAGWWMPGCCLLLVALLLASLLPLLFPFPPVALLTSLLPLRPFPAPAHALAVVERLFLSCLCACPSPLPIRLHWLAGPPTGEAHERTGCSSAS